MPGVVFVVAVITLSSGWAYALDEFVLTSPQFNDGDRMGEEQVYEGFGCKGGNISPELVWTNAPDETKSFAVTVYDPDAPTGSGWWHWVVYNLPPSSTGLARGAGNPRSTHAPTGAVQSRTDFNRLGYGGPCPPVGHGDHRYVFTVFALDVGRLLLKEDSPAAMVGYYLNKHALARASLTGIYSR